MKKRILLVMTALVLMLGCFGCKAKNPEESASTAEIVEGTQQNTENGDLPQQVKPSEGGSGGSTPGSSSQPSGNQTPGRRWAGGADARQCGKRERYKCQSEPAGEYAGGGKSGG